MEFVVTGGYLMEVFSLTGYCLSKARRLGEEGMDRGM